MKVKKFIALALVSLILASSASAEVICLKNGRKFKVSAANNVNVKASKFITTAESTCPNGYTALLNAQKKLNVYTGAWNLAGGANQDYAACQISFPQALSAAPSAVIFVEASTTNPTCTGSVQNPTAPA